MPEQGEDTGVVPALLGDLQDVDSQTAPAVGDTLTWNGSEWVASNPATAQGPASYGLSTRMNRGDVMAGAAGTPGRYSRSFAEDASLTVSSAFPESLTPLEVFTTTNDFGSTIKTLKLFPGVWRCALAFAGSNPTGVKDDDWLRIYTYGPFGTVSEVLGDFPTPTFYSTTGRQLYGRVHIPDFTISARDVEEGTNYLTYDIYWRRLTGTDELATGDIGELRFGCLNVSPGITAEGVDYWDEWYG